MLAAGCAGMGAATKQATPADGTPRPLVTAIKAAEQDGKVVLQVEADQPLKNYLMFKMEKPLRLQLDLPGAKLDNFSKNIPVNKGPVGFVRPVQAGADTAAFLEIILNRPAAYEVSADGAMLKVTIGELAEQAATAAPAQVQAGPGAKPEAVEKSAAAPPAAPTATAPAKPAVAVVPGTAAKKLTGIDILSSPEGTQVVIEGDGNLDYEYFLVENKMLVVDVQDVANAVAPLTRKVSDEYVKQVRIGEHFEPRRKVRVVMDLTRPSEYKVVSTGDKLLVNFGSLATQADEKIKSTLTGVVTDIFFKPLADRSQIEIICSKETEYEKIESADPARLILEIPDMRVAPAAQKTMDLATLNRAVSKVVSLQYLKDNRTISRVIVQFREPSPYRIDSVDKKKIVIDVPHAAAAITSEPAKPADDQAATAAATGTGSATRVIGDIKPDKRYVGQEIFLDFKEAEIQDVLRLISETSGINFVSGPEVKGKVTIKLAGVPWDQALDVILKTNEPALTYVREADNIIRVTTSDKVRKSEMDELDNMKRKQDIQDKLVKIEDSPVLTETMLISYGDVTEIKNMVDGMKDEKDKKLILSASSDKRTNTLILKDRNARNLQTAKELIKQLDVPTPAVMIEARIISVNNDYSRQLGIQWGFDYFADAAHGNPTGAAFPNSISMGGTTTGDSTGTNSNSTGYLVNLPATGATSAIGLSLGHIANTFNLDLRLSAMESMGKGEVLSHPKVLVVQNEKAIINVGSQLPISKTDAEGNRSTEFKDVGIMLEVTPQITADRRVFMKVKVERSAKGEDVNTSEGLQFSIETQRAETKVLLTDGETSVIGGLFQQTKSDSDNSVPFLSKIPILGWLFKSQAVSDRRSELLIFLTPKIVTY
jgi:type IV pilus assembly protein PilQ